LKKLSQSLPWRETLTLKELRASRIKSSGSGIPVNFKEIPAKAGLIHPNALISARTASSRIAVGLSE